jgi:hypothetical protein
MSRRVPGRKIAVFLQTRPFRGKWISYQRRPRQTGRPTLVRCLRCRGESTTPGDAGWSYRRVELQGGLSAQLCGACLAALRVLDTPN